MLKLARLARRPATCRPSAHGARRPFASAGAPLSRFVGAQTPYTHECSFYYPHVHDLPAAMPVFRLMDDEGAAVAGGVLPDLDEPTCVQMMETMVSVNEFDKVFFDAQRQGRLSFYFTNRGEEACAVGSCAALKLEDWIWPQYRELGAIFWRGYTYEEAANQCCHNELDMTKGRQLPMHIGSPEKYSMYVKSNLGQQVPAATGAAYFQKLLGKERCAITYFGEGCASEGDIPSALNIAAVHGCPTIFFCRNNGYAISTHTDDQYKSDGIAPRGVAFGMPSIRVDGNDIFAVYAATARAREIAVREGKPTMIEAMSYRINSHSTSDDDSKYRRSESPEAGYDSERDYWEARSPIVRFGKHLIAKGWWSAQREDDLRKVLRKRAITALNDAEKIPQPHPKHLYTDVFDTIPWHLELQQATLKDHLTQYREHYPDVSDEHINSL